MTTARSRYQFSGRKVFDLREALKLSREKLSALLKVTPQTLYNWERCKTFPNADALCRLAYILEVTPHELFTESTVAQGYEGVLKAALKQPEEPESTKECPF